MDFLILEYAQNVLRLVLSALLEIIIESRNFHILSFIFIKLGQI